MRSLLDGGDCGGRNVGEKRIPIIVIFGTTLFAYDNDMP